MKKKIADSSAKVENTFVTQSRVTIDEETENQKTAGEGKTNFGKPNEEVEDQRILMLKKVKRWLKRLKYNIRPTYMCSGCTSCSKCCSRRCSKRCSFCGCSFSKDKEKDIKFSVKKNWVFIISSLHYLLELVQT